MEQKGSGEMKTYRDALGKLVGTDEYDATLGFIAYNLHVKKHGKIVRKEAVSSFFDKGGFFDSFLELECDEDIVRWAQTEYDNRMSKREQAENMIDEAEAKIREAYRIIDNLSFIANHDFLGEQERTHTVSLVGIHDEDKKGEE